MHRGLLLLGALACGEGSGDGDGTDDRDASRDLEVPAAVSVAVSPEAPRTRADDLTCTAGGAELVWWVDGAPWEGDAAVDADAGTSVVAASELVPGQTWTCVATPVGEGGVRGPSSNASATVARPNVVWIIADDLGLGDVSTYGGTAPTPNLDAIADAGVRFDAAYVSAPACSPSRAGLWTGVQQNRFGFEFNLGNPDTVEVEARGLPYDVPTLAEVVDEAGYATALIGKWHLGYRAHQHPLGRGFDDFFGFLAGQRLSLEPGQPGQIDYWPLENTPPKWPSSHWTELVTRNGETVTLSPTEHLTDRFGDEASAYVREHAEEPFFLTLSFHVPHEPIQATAEHLALLAVPPADDAHFAYQASVAAMDAAIGTVLDALEDEGLADDTLVVFFSDHGCPDYYGYCSNLDYSGGKLRLSEGGLRVPMLMAWPDRLPEGLEVPDPISTFDLFPTVTSAIGAEAPDDLDGVDLLDWLAEEAPSADPPHDALYWRLGSARAVRDGAWKMVQVLEGDTWLFNLEDDPGETTNLAASEAETMAELAEAMDDVMADWEAPMWSPRTRSGVPYFDTTRTVPF